MFPHVLYRHMKGSPHPPKAPVPPMGYVSSTLGSDLGTNLQCEEEEEDEGYGVSRQLCGFDYTAGLSMDNLEGSGETHMHAHTHKHTRIMPFLPSRHSAPLQKKHMLNLQFHI